MATAPKKPQDRLAPQAPAATEPERPEGWELLKPYDEVPVWEQLELVEIVKPLIPSGSEPGQAVEVNLDLNTLDLNLIGNLAKKLQEFAVEPEAYLTFVSGPKALNRSIELGIWYAMQLGESGRSTTS